jgi:hypothetical protein
VRSAFVAAVVLLLLPSAALAHGGGSEHGYVSAVEQIVGAQGIDAEASADGHFSFTAPAGKTVVVRGYEGEPYLRFQNGEVYENRASATAYVNRDRPPPTSAMADVKPQWRVVGRGRTYTWEDRRTRWTAANEPVAVERDPDSRHHVSDWTIRGTVDGAPFAIHGSLDWAPAERGLGWQWLLVPVLGGAALYALYLTFASGPRATPAPRPH